jgi:hypothetical protein
MKKIFPYLFICLFVFIFFWQFFLKGLLPIPADDIVGLYNPFRDYFAKDYPNGIPFKNFLITDPVRQQYLWRELVISAEKRFDLPLWNPYNFTGTPLLANFQSGSFYFLNVLFLFLPFSTAWSLIIFLGPLLSGIFLYLYLNNLRLSKLSSVFGGIAYSFSGFFVAWMEWGTITQVGLWLPLVLLSIDKLFTKKNFVWVFIYCFSVVSAFFAGHLQIFFYLYIFSLVYLMVRWFQFRARKHVIILFLILNLILIAVTSIQWLPTFQYISLSARNIDVLGIDSSGWFVPWQNAFQFIAPDYFGNPATLNYWGIWNYGELVGYVGITPLILAIFAMFYRRDRKTLFFGTVLFISIFLTFPTYLAKIPYLLKIPFLSTAQPSRLLFIVDFTLAVLSAFGFDYLLREKKKIVIIYPLIFVAILLACLWIFIPKEHFLVTGNNLKLPTFLFVLSVISFALLLVLKDKKKLTTIIYIALLGITIFDLFRFGWKFNPFTDRSYLFPSTEVTSFLVKNLGNYRYMTTDSRIFPPNFSSIYRLESVDGYDPLYLQRYGELIIAAERNKPDIAPPFGFNRIITPHNYGSKIMDLSGVKYILSLSSLNSPRVKKVFQEGQTIIYENLNVLPRAFFAEKLEPAKNGQEAINFMFDRSFNPGKIAVVENFESGMLSKRFEVGQVNINVYSENKIVLKTANGGLGFLVLTDSYYPAWKATVDGKITKIYRTDYNFRGVIVPPGNHLVEFFTTLF